MSYKKITFNYLIVVLVLLTVSLFLTLQPSCYFKGGVEYCHDSDYLFSESVGQPLELMSTSLVIPLLLLLFLPETVILSWKKFAKVFLPIGILLIIITPVDCGGGFGLNICFDKELVGFFVSGATLGLSIIIIAYNAIKFYFFKSPQKDN